MEKIPHRDHLTFAFDHNRSGVGISGQIVHRPDRNTDEPTVANPIPRTPSPRSVSLNPLPSISHVVRSNGGHQRAPLVWAPEYMVQRWAQAAVLTYYMCKWDAGREAWLDQHPEYRTFPVSEAS